MIEAEKEGATFGTHLLSSKVDMYSMTMRLVRRGHDQLIRRRERERVLE